MPAIRETGTPWLLDTIIKADFGWDKSINILPSACAVGAFQPAESQTLSSASHVKVRALLDGGEMLFTEPKSGTGSKGEKANGPPTSTTNPLVVLDA